MHERFDRRTHLRDLWTTTQATKLGLELIFFLDALDEDDKHMTKVEQARHKDVLPLLTPRGLRLAERVLEMMETIDSLYADRYDFIIFSDDDVFWCPHQLSMLLTETKTHVQKPMIGYVHSIETGRFLDQHAMIISRSITQEVIKYKWLLHCSPFGDVSLTSWIFDVLRPANVTVHYSSALFPHTRSKGIVQRLLRSKSPICVNHLNYHYIRDRKTYIQMLQNYAQTLSKTPDQLSNPKFYYRLFTTRSLGSEDEFEIHLRLAYNVTTYPCDKVPQHAWQELLHGKRSYEGGL